jgi:hypothetical protein
MNIIHNFIQYKVQRELQAVLDSIKENYFHGAFEVWKNIRSQGDYFEGDVAKFLF